MSDKSKGTSLHLKTEKRGKVHLETSIKTTTSEVNHGCEEDDVVSGPFGAAWHGIWIDMHGDLPGVPAERAQVHLENRPCIYHGCGRLPRDPCWGLLDPLPQHEEQDVSERRTPTARPSLHH